MVILAHKKPFCRAELLGNKILASKGETYYGKLDETMFFEVHGRKGH